MKKEVTVKIKFITPAFIGGVYKKEKGELRASSFKGLLRYWWRAICSDNLNLDEMKEKEEAIFGGQNNKSSFDLRIEKINSKNDLKKDRENILKKTGIRYLLFPFYFQNININNINFIPSNSEFNIKFIFWKEEFIVEVLKALWALENFGGIGARSRRGVGSFKVIKIDVIDGLNNELKNKLPKFLYEEKINRDFKIENFINENLKNKYIEYPPNTIQEFTRYSNNFFKIKVINKNNFKNWYDALNYIGNIYMDFRKQIKSDSSALYNFLKSNKPLQEPIKRTAFGLPIIFKFKSLNLTAKPEEKPKENDNYPRRASPMFIKIGEYNGHYYILLTLIWSKFLPDNMKISIENNLIKALIDQPDKNIIEEFFKKLG